MAATNVTIPIFMNSPVCVGDPLISLTNTLKARKEKEVTNKKPLQENCGTSFGFMGFGFLKLNKEVYEMQDRMEKFFNISYYTYYQISKTIGFVE